MLAPDKVNLSIIIPVFNEEENVECLYHEIITAISPCPLLFEVIFVNDGSTDNTYERLKRLAFMHKNMSVISHQKNYGQSASLLTGARIARYPLIVTMDGDGQNDPADIPHLISYMKDSKTVILGNRIKRDDSMLRKFSSYIGNTVRRLLLHDDCPDTGCSLKIFPRDAFLTLPHFKHFHRFLPALFKRAGFNLINLSVNHRPRRYGVSKYGVMNRLFVGIHDLIGVRWLLKRPCNPELLHDEE